MAEETGSRGQRHARSRVPPASARAPAAPRWARWRTGDQCPVAFDVQREARAWCELCAKTAPGATRPILANETFPCSVCTPRSEEHTSELQSLMRISYAVFCLKKKNYNTSP